MGLTSLLSIMMTIIISLFTICSQRLVDGDGRSLCLRFGNGYFVVHNIMLPYSNKGLMSNLGRNLENLIWFSILFLPLEWRSETERISIFQ